MGELGRYREAHEIVLPKIDKEYTDAWVIGCEDVLILRSEEREREEHRESV